MKSMSLVFGGLMIVFTGLSFAQSDEGFCEPPEEIVVHDVENCHDETLVDELIDFQPSEIPQEVQQEIQRDIQKYHEENPNQGIEIKPYIQTIQQKLPRELPRTGGYGHKE